MNRRTKLWLLIAAGLAIVVPTFGASGRAAAWPVLKTYEGEALSRVKMPMGGIGTGTISLSGRGSLVDWEIHNRPAKGVVPNCLKTPHFAIRYQTEAGERKARILEGPLTVAEYEGSSGSPVANHGFPRFRKAVFRAAYPLAQIDLSDPAFLLAPHLESFNPLVPGDSDASGIPAILLRWSVTNPTKEPLRVSLAGTIPLDTDLVLAVAGEVGDVTRATDIRSPGWNVAADRYWEKFLSEGIVADTPKGDSTAVHPARTFQLCVKFRLGPGETRRVPFVLAWRDDNRKAWRHYDDADPKYTVGNWYCTRYATARAAADDLLSRLPELEAKTVAFVKGVLAKEAPAVIKEAALFNLSTLRSETCFRTRDGRFFGWEGCQDARGSCPGSCSHVWGYEHALVDLWPDLAKSMTETYFRFALNPETGAIVNRVALPLAGDRIDRTNGGGTVAAADGQMQCIVKACENWKKTGDDVWLRGLWPDIRKAMAFAWIAGGWDADRDGVMEGCQHNTMDVEYYGPNPQMEFLYLAALKASAAMASACGDAAFAETCRNLAVRGSDWTEKNLFNGDYYEHRIVPPKGPIAEELRDPNMGARDLSDPDYQLGAGCLIDQLLGEFSAHAAGLDSVVDTAHAKRTLATILAKCRKGPRDETFNGMRGFALDGETSIMMAWYPEERRPRSPFPYYSETMTGFEYVVAALLVRYGDRDEAERVVGDVRARYDGIRRNPFDEAECGHHYARALDAWSVLRFWEERSAEGGTTTFARDAFKKYLDSGEIPGVITVFCKGDEREVFCGGYASVEEKRPMTLDGVFQQCSQTKGFCGVTAAILAEEGKIDLDAPVCKYLPEFSSHKAITVRMCLSHTSGLPFEVPNYESMGGWARRMPIRSAAAIAASLPLKFDPGTGVQYSNIGIDVAAAVVEVASGMRWEDFLARRVLLPLGMNDTGFKPTDEQLARRIEIYTVKPGRKAVHVDAMKSMQRPFSDDRVFPSSGAGIWTTVRDQLRFYRMLMNLGVGDNGVRILKEETVKTLLAKSQRPKSLGGGGYSFGLVAPYEDAEDQFFGHGGAWVSQCLVNWHRKELRLLAVQFDGGYEYRDVCAEAANRFFRHTIDDSGVNAHTGRMN